MKKIAVPFLIFAFVTMLGVSSFAKPLAATTTAEAIAARVDEMSTKLDSIRDRLVHVETLLVGHNVDVSAAADEKSAGIEARAQISTDFPTFKSAVTTFVGNQSQANRDAVHAAAVTLKADVKSYVDALKAYHDALLEIATAAGYGPN